MHARQFAQALALQRQNNWARFVTMQDHYNLIYREEENEMLPLCSREGVAVMPWSPLARGRLTRPWGETTARLVSDEVGKALYNATDENDELIATNLAAVAEELDANRAQVALAWLLSKPGVAAPIIGASRQEQLDELLHAVDLTLTPDQIEKLETPYKPHRLWGSSNARFPADSRLALRLAGLQVHQHLRTTSSPPPPGKACLLNFPEAPGQPGQTGLKKRPIGQWWPIIQHPGGNHPGDNIVHHDPHPAVDIAVEPADGPRLPHIKEAENHKSSGDPLPVHRR